MQRAQPPLEFIPQRFNPLMRQVVQWLLPVLLRFRTRPWLPAGIAQVKADNVEVLVNLYEQFQAGKVRFLLAFRHPEVDDPLCMFHLLSCQVPRVARQQGKRLRSPIHSYFIYERGMTLWAGTWLGWLFSRLGGTPIRRGKLDWTGLRAARDLFVNGRFPIAIAPEGATNGHSSKVSPLEPGVAQLGFWCAEDLQKSDRPESVLIVPIAIQYQYTQPPWPALHRLFSQLETDIGLPTQPYTPATHQEPKAHFYPRLLRLGEAFLLEMEQFYRQFYHQPLPDLEPEEQAPSSSSKSLLERRLQRLLDTALQVSERHFGLTHHGNLIDRCRRLEEASWSCIYREDLPHPKTLPLIKRGLADWMAEESEAWVRHMRLVESFVAVTGAYVHEQPTAERMAEMALLMFDLTARLKRQKLPHRPRLGWRRAQITVGEPISVTERLSAYRSSRQAARQAVTDLTHDLQRALEDLIS